MSQQTRFWGRNNERLTNNLGMPGGGYGLPRLGGLAGWADYYC